MKPFFSGMISLLCLVLSACKSLPTPPTLAEEAPTTWHAPLAHSGQIAELTNWWEQFKDPLLVELITSAQNASPTIASAKTNIAKAQANATTASANFLPSIQGQAGVQRGTYNVSPSNQDALANQGQIGLQTSWEIDVFGSNRAQSTSAQARYEGSVAAWHDARISVAAETATLYVGYLTCQAVLADAKQDIISRRLSTKINQHALAAGLINQGDFALINASTADAENRYIDQQTQCTQALKALVVLTAIPEDELQAKLKTQTSFPNLEHAINVAQIPAQVIMQRPDVFNVEKELWAARSDIGYAQAQRYPRIFLNGFISRNRVDVLGTENYLSTWSIGPLALSIPIFEGGRISAQIHTTEVRYTEVLKTYEAKVRQAVREVEEALIKLDAAKQRYQLATTSLQQYTQARIAIERQYQAGLASQLDLENARRIEFTAHMNYAQIKQENFNSLVSLYRAVGGDWKNPNYDAHAGR